MAKFTFTLEEDGSVFIYDGVNIEPAIYQPNWPDGTDWAEGEAEAWARQFILAQEDETADLPGDTPSQPTKERVAEVYIPTEFDLAREAAIAALNAE